jgi:hypothetical protein
MRHGQNTDRCQSIPKSRGTWRARRLVRRLEASVVAFALLGFPTTRAQNAKPTDYEVKAAYLYNFGRFVEWPAKAAEAQTDSFAICVLGQDPFGPVLNTALSKETIAGKSVVVKRLPAPDATMNCRVLFISSSEDNRLKQILISLGGASVLTVSDLPQFTRRGGMVQFVIEGSRVRFEVNLATAERAGLTLSSELLKVATNVRRSAPGD